MTYSNINAARTSGEVDFSLAPGAYTYFSLESSPDSINGGGGIVVGGGGTSVPEPASALLIFAGLSSMGLFAQARRRLGW